MLRNCRLVNLKGKNQYFSDILKLVKFLSLKEDIQVFWSNFHTEKYVLSDLGSVQRGNVQFIRVVC